MHNFILLQFHLVPTLNAMYVCMYVCGCVYIFVCMYVLYTNRHTNVTDVDVKLNPGSPWQKQLSTRGLSPANWTEIKEETSKVLNLEHSFVWC